MASPDIFAPFRQPDGGLVDQSNLYHADEQELVQSLLGFCCCGNPATLQAYLRSALEHVAEERPEGKAHNAWYDGWRVRAKALHGTDGAEMLFLYVADRAGWIEHGSSVNCGWLTEKGKALLEILRAVPEVNS